MLKKTWSHFQFYLVLVLLVLFSVLTTLSFAGTAVSDAQTLPTLLKNESSFNSTYYAAYPCTFLHCMVLPEHQDILFSKVGHDFLERTQYFLLIGTLLLAVLFFIHAHSAASMLIHGGFIVALFGATGFVLSYVPKWISWGPLDWDVVFAHFAFLQIYLFVLFGIGIILIIAGFIYAGKGLRSV